MAHFRSLAPASTGLHHNAETSTNLLVDGAPYWVQSTDDQEDDLTRSFFDAQPFRPCPWLGEFIPLWKARARTSASVRDAVAKPGVLCPKCTEFCSSLTMVVRAAETDQTPISTQGNVLAVFSHHESLRALLRSSHFGCHLCTILWQELEIEDYDTSGMNYLKSKLQKSEQSKDFKITVRRFYDVYKQRNFGYRLDVHDNHQNRISMLGLNIAHKDTESTVVKSSVSKAYRTDSVHHMALLKRWVSECLGSHKSCNLRVETSSDMPKRVLDLSRVNVDGKVRVIEPRKQGSTGNGYAALSYCWGKGETYQLTSSTMSALFRGVHISTLPRTVQDAVRVTLTVELRYLWVDALCIQQDSMLDWNEEAKQMMSVYSNSLLTIAGTGATSCEDGLFGVRDPLVHLPCPLFDLGDDHEVSTSVSFSPLISWHSFAGLHGRGWVVQERLLAPRTINFGVCAVWECREKLASDCTTKDSYVGQHDMRKKFAELVLSQDGSDYHRRELMKLWYIILGQYTGSALSHKSDRLAAINGIMSAFQKQGYTPWFGVWKPLSIWELMWTVPIAYYNDAAKERGPDLNDFPTWSWAHLNLDVNYPLLPYQAPYSDVVYTADLSDNEKCDCSDHEFRCEQRTVSIKAKLVPVEIRPSKNQFQTLNRISHLLGTQVDDNTANIVWEDGLPGALIGHHAMVVLVIRRPSHNNYRCAGLLLAPSDDTNGSVQRIGVADFEMNGEVFKAVMEMPQAHVTLV